jgi:gluconolactonase
MTQSGLDVRDGRLPGIAGDGEVTRVQGGFEFLEGPVWDPGDESLIFSDIPASTLYRLTADGKVGVYREQTSMANGNAWDSDGRLVTCEHVTSRVVREAVDGTLEVLADRYRGQELNCPNDVVTTRDGRILFTDPTFGRIGPFGGPREIVQDAPAVYSIDPGTGELTRVCQGFEQPNGLCLSADEGYLFVNDTSRRHIKRFAFGAGHLGDGEVWATVTGAGEGAPDGMKIDSAGHLWVTAPGGVQVFAADGTCLGTVLVPEKVANFTWGGPGLKTLYLTAGTTLFSRPVNVPGPVSITRRPR